ncbi:MAG: SDR family oxidoreductase [Pseudomonadales bacterium]|nr:SDR family oxidoreductase [Pseudomonadales bacterium]
MKSIFITGAAAGIGRATAQRFAKEGWFVGLVDRDAAPLETLQQELGKSNSSTHLCDVTDMASVTKAIEQFGKLTNGKMQVLFNNAGILRVGRFEEIDIAEHRKIVEINVIGAMNVLHAAFPLLKVSKPSQVINLSSASAVYGTPDFASYSASKHAVRALTEALSIEWQEYGINVCDLMPPFVNTEMVSSQRAASPIISRMGVNLDASDIAEEAWRLTKKPTLHRPVTRIFRTAWPVARSTPPTIMRTFMKTVAGR